MRSARTRRPSHDGPVDLRSDTVTRPTRQMRDAMAAAEVDDDVLGHDPTMRELETRVAGLLGTDDALWTPSGSMGNLIALMSHLTRGDAFPAFVRGAAMPDVLGGINIPMICTFKGVHAVADGRSLMPYIGSAIGGMVLCFGGAYLTANYS